MTDLNHLILLGAPGSGKGTQAEIFVSQHGYDHISTGNLLRAEVAAESELGLEIKGIMERGELVSDELVTRLLKKNLDLEHKSYIFDGFPRTLEQCRILNEQILGEAGCVAVYLDVDTEKLVERISNRRVSPNGVHIYNLVTKPPKVEGKCDVTGEDLVHRADDQEEVVRKRMDVFTSEIEPILGFYKDLGLLNTISADQDIQSITQQLTELTKKNN